MMNIQKLLSSALAISLVSTSALPVFADEIDLDEQVFQSPTTTEVQVFNDVPESHWALPHINDAVAAGFFGGVDENNFAPDATLTRTQFTIALLKVCQAELLEDVEGEPWYAMYYHTAKALGMLPENVTLENFDLNIPREEMAAMAILTIGEKHFEDIQGNPEDIQDFEDISEDFEDFVLKTFATKIMLGKDLGFIPQGTALRGEATVVVNNVSKYLLSLEDATEEDDLTDEDITDENITDEDTADEEEYPVGNEMSQKFAAIIDSVRSQDEVDNIRIITSTEDPVWDMFSMSFGFTGEDVEGFAIAAPLVSYQAYCIAVIKPVEGSLTTIINGLDGYMEMQSSQLGFYNPEQGEIAENGVIITIADDTIVFAMKEDAKEVADALLAELTLG